MTVAALADLSRTEVGSATRVPVDSVRIEGGVAVPALPCSNRDISVDGSWIDLTPAGSRHERDRPAPVLLHRPNRLWVEAMTSPDVAGIAGLASATLRKVFGGARGSASNQDVRVAEAGRDAGQSLSSLNTTVTAARVELTILHCPTRSSAPGGTIGWNDTRNRGTLRYRYWTPDCALAVTGWTALVRTMRPSLLTRTSTTYGLICYRDLSNRRSGVGLVNTELDRFRPRSCLSNKVLDCCSSICHRGSRGGSECQAEKGVSGSEGPRLGRPGVASDLECQDAESALLARAPSGGFRTDWVDGWRVVSGGGRAGGGDGDPPGRFGQSD